MAVIEEWNIDGAIVRIHDDYIRSREESVEILQRVADNILRQLNAQHNAKRYKELNEQNEKTAEQAVEGSGQIPKGHVLIFGDGNKLNVSLDNLNFLVSRQQLLVLNRYNLIQNDADLTRTGIIIADIKTKINDRKQKGDQITKRYYHLGG